jgi:hypothetical protein
VDATLVGSAVVALGRIACTQVAPLMLSEVKLFPASGGASGLALSRVICSMWLSHAPCVFLAVGSVALTITSTVTSIKPIVVEPQSSAAEKGFIL